MKCEDTNLVEWLDKIMSEYHKVFVIFDKKFYELLRAKKGNDNKILFLFPNDGFGEYPEVSYEEGERLRQLYFMYEFSDRFQVLSRNEYFGGLLNFVDTGVLTYEELVDALL